MFGANRLKDTGMQLTIERLAASVLIIAAMTGCVTSPSAAKPIPVEVWRGGDDGLTARFGDALEAAFRAAPEFALSTGKVSGTLIVTIPSNVSWHRVGGGTEVTYSVQFSGTASSLRGNSVGACPEEQLEKCAAQVVRDAKVVTMGKKP